jgi:hypothetical protein
VQQSTAKLLYCKRDILKEIATAKADLKVKERHNYDDIIDKLQIEFNSLKAEMMKCQMS